MSSTSPPNPPPLKPRFAPYRQALQSVAARTGTPLPSLLLSFGVLHELTAIVPLVGIFFGARALGVGERVVNAIEAETASGDGQENSWVKIRSREWLDEGSVWADKVGRRYGIFGYEKRKPGEGPVVASAREAEGAAFTSNTLSTRLAGDAANAIVAYGVTKALLPVRIGLSLYLSPAFSRRVVEPIRLGISRLFRGQP